MAAASKYFKAMFSSNMKEVREGTVNLLNVESPALQTCIEFMYTGRANITNLNVESTLVAATLLQLDKLAKMCFNFLRENISAENCILAVRVAELYDQKLLAIQAKDFIVNKFQDVIRTHNFSSLDAEDFLYYLEKSSSRYEITWEAITAWFANDEEKLDDEFEEIIQAKGISDFPFEYLLDFVVNGRLLKNSAKLRNFATNLWFSNIGMVKVHTAVKNFYEMKNFAKEYNAENQEEIDEILAEFLEEKLQELSKLDGFLDLPFLEILALYASSKTQYYPEETKWFAAIKWVKHDDDVRTEIFPSLFKAIRLDLLPSRFIENVIRREPLVDQFEECRGSILDFYSQMNRMGPANRVACLDTGTGELVTLNGTTRRWSPLSSIGRGAVLGIACIKRELYVVKENALVKLNRNGTWRSLPSPHQTFEKSHKVACFRDRLFVVGSQSMSTYDPIRNQWNANLPGCGLDDRFCVAASSQVLYAAAGTGSFAKQYSDITRSWSSLPGDDYVRHHASAVVFRDVLLVIGGVNEYRQAHSSISCYHPVSSSWFSSAKMSVHRKRFSACVAGDAVYVVGGACDFLGQYRNEDTVEVWKNSDRQWKTVDTLKSCGFVTCCPYYDC